jgi:hypothetical protein
MRVISVLIGVILLVLLCSVPAHAQLSGTLSGPAFPPLNTSQPTQFRVILVSGSQADFVPSSFMAFEQAVALGAANPAHTRFMSFEQAVQKGIADLNAQAKSPAEAARQYRRQRHQTEAESKRDNTTL